MHFEYSPSLSIPLIKNNSLRFVHDLPHYSVGHAILITITIVGPTLIFGIQPFLALKQKSSVSHSKQTLFMWICAAFGMTGSVAFTSMLYTDQGNYRYLVSLWAWPLIFVAATALRLRLPAIAGCLFLISGSSLVAVIVGWMPQSKSVLSWDPELAVCLRTLRGRLQLHAGLADYWSSRPTEIALDWSIQIDQVTPDGQAFDWGNDMR